MMHLPAPSPSRSERGPGPAYIVDGSNIGSRAGLSKRPLQSVCHHHVPPSLHQVDTKTGTSFIIQLWTIMKMTTVDAVEVISV